MTAPLPIVERIAVAFEAALNGITTGNGYNQTLEAVRPARLAFEGDTAPKDLRVVIIQDDPLEDDENSSQGNSSLKAWIQPFVCVCFVINSDKDTAALDTRANLVRADIEKRVMLDRKWGGLAMNTVVKPSERFDDTEIASSGIVVVVNVHYRTREDNPYAVG